MTEEQAKTFLTALVKSTEKEMLWNTFVVIVESSSKDQWS